MECPKCKTNNKEEAICCRNCGEKLAIKCPQCGRIFPLDAKYCDECCQELSINDASNEGKSSVKTPKTKTKAVVYCVLLVLAYLIIFYLTKPINPEFVDYQNLILGKLSDVEKQTITMWTELNKYLISIATLMFGVLGFYLTIYRREFQIKWLTPPIIIVIIFLGFTYYYAFMVYSEIANELGQNALARNPERSRIFYYLKMEFWTSLNASITMLLIFAYLIIRGSAKKSSLTGQI